MRFITFVELLLLVAAAFSSELCWKKTTTRGVGTIPSVCGPGEEKNGLLCYPHCRSGYKGLAFVCWQNCPSGFHDDGAFCRKPAPYGRGAGYPWKFGDPLNDSKMYQRCRAANPGNPCEKWGAVVYPKCREGFHNTACCICSPNCIWGMVDIGVSCTKKSYTRATHTPGCGSSKEKDAGLCYPWCPSGYNGVGPVCWKRCSGSHPVDCGMACATSKQACIEGTSEMVTSVLEVVVDIAAAVGTGGGSAVAKTSAKAAIKKAMQSLGKMTRTQLKNKIKKAAKDAGRDLAENTVNALADAAETGEFDWSSLDPTGIASVVKAYNHSVC